MYICFDELDRKKLQGEFNMEINFECNVFQVTQTAGPFGRFSIL